MRNEKNNLVLGAVRDYTFEQLRPFVVSLKRTSFKGELVLLWNHLSPATLAALQEHGAKLVYFEYRGSGTLNSWSRFWPQVRPVVRLPLGESFRRSIYGKILNLPVVRYLHALKFLEAHCGEYLNILLTDVRDVIFQDDPFRDSLAGDVVAFLEAPHMKFGDESMNDGWIRDNYGEATSSRLAGKRISCCGTVMGTEVGMVDYLRAFVAEIGRLKSVSHGADTSVHNILVRESLVDRIAVVENFQSAVGTINTSPLSSAVIGSDGRVLGPSGFPVSVLHQYDRDAALMNQLVMKYAS
jgi:hypothetical protein